MESNAIPVPPKPHLEGILTVMPMAVTEPRRIRHVSYGGGEGGPSVGGSGILKACLNVVLYYACSSGPAGDQDSGWVAAGWMKTSLARAMSEQPLISGRVRRCEVDKTGDCEKLEVVSNDSGARLLEATMPVSLSEFMEMDDKVRAEAEADLVFWKEIDEITTQFSPLFYVQVTNFKCGGYSVGISCSLLVADLLITDNFLQRWAQIQQNVVPKFTAGAGSDGVRRVKQLPIFYLPNLKPNGSFPPEVFSSTPSRGQALTFLLKSTQNDAGLIASLNEAQRKVKGGIIPDKFRVVEVVVGKEESPAVGVLEVKTWRKSDDEATVGAWGDDRVGRWDELRMGEVCFYEGMKPVGLARWAGWPNDDDGFLMAFTHPIDGGSVVLVAVPGGEKRQIR